MTDRGEDDNESEEWLDAKNIDYGEDGEPDYTYTDDNGHEMTMPGHTDRSITVYCEKCETLVEATRESSIEE